MFCLSVLGILHERKHPNSTNRRRVIHSQRC